MERGADSVMEPAMESDHVPTAIVGPNPVLCEGLSRVLNKTAFKTVELAAHVDFLSLGSLPQQKPVLLIIDAGDNPGGATGQIESFRQSHAAGRIVILANHCQPEDMVAVFRSGANAYFATIATCEDFVKSLDLVMQGQTILPSEGIATALERDVHLPPNDLGRPDKSPRARDKADDPLAPRFSDRELYILRCLTEGSSNKVIARECDIAEGTVKVHVKAILRKIRVRNRTQAAIWALNNRSLVWPSVRNAGGPTATGTQFRIEASPERASTSDVVLPGGDNEAGSHDAASDPDSEHVPDAG